MVKTVIKNEYSYYTFPKYDKDQGYTNSYGYNVLRSMVDRMNELLQKQKAVGGPLTDEEAQALEDAMLDIMAQDQEHVSNEELRYYMNEAVWFATKQTVKICLQKNLLLETCTKLTFVKRFRQITNHLIHI